MSNVTTVILSIGVLDWNDEDNERGNLNKINAFFPDPKSGFVSMEDKKLPHGWYGGTKFLESELYIGSFNYLNLEKLKQHLRSINWQEPEYIQLIIKEQEDYGFRIENISETTTSL